MFPETRWTLVTATRDPSRDVETQAALSELCAAYYDPVRLFLRREGRSDDDARELAQEFFARILAKKHMDGPDPEKGRFRSYLLGALKHFLAARRQHSERGKRGEGVVPESLDQQYGTAPGLQPVDESQPAPDAAFDRLWALTVLDRTLQALTAGMEAEGQGNLCAALTPFLIGNADYGDIEAAAARIGTTPGALRVAIHRLRSRYRDLIRRELAQTLGPRVSVEDELAALKAALRAR